MNQNSETTIAAQKQDREVLFSIRNLKQYFPVKGSRNMFVKANDGINLDIYKNETFGLVGESGCGKSTFGRVILNIYHQTDGRTMYYGKTLDDIVPKYVKHTYEHFYKLRDRVKSLQAEYEKDKAQYEKMSQKEQFEHHAALDALEKKSRDSFNNVVSLMGGLYGIEQPDKEIAKLLEIYAAGRKRFEVRQKALPVFQKYEKEIAARKDIPELNSSKQKSIAKYYELSDEIAKLHQELSEMKKAYADNPEFQKYEKYFDNGIDISRLQYDEMRPLRQELQLVFQDPYSSLNPRMTAGQIIAAGLDAHGIFADDEDAKQDYIVEIMEKCGLQAYMVHRYPHQFSGGQRQRIGIARSLALNPEFVVCDEAVSALDVSIQSQVINLLSDLKQENNLTYLFISHDLSVVKYISDRIGVMYLGSLVELAETDDMFESPRHPYTEALLSAIPTTDEGDRDKKQIIIEGDIPSPVNPPKGCKFHTRCRYATEECKHIIPQWQEVSPGHFVACHHMLPEHSGIKVRQNG